MVSNLSVSHIHNLLLYNLLTLMYRILQCYGVFVVCFFVVSVHCRCFLDVKIKGKGHPCTGTEALYRPYGPQGE